jgi:NTP pyrophosphatase (non-canonical NTP hydrolase)
MNSLQYVSSILAETTPDYKFSSEQANSVCLDIIGHIIEEAVELRQLHPRKAWVPYKSPENASDLAKLEEAADIVIFVMLYVRYLGHSCETFETVLRQKAARNASRPERLGHVWPTENDFGTRRY